MNNRRMTAVLAMAGLVLAGGCDGLDSTGYRGDSDPRDLTVAYDWVLDRWTEGQVEGTPLVELTWELPGDFRDEVFRVYARNARSGGFGLIATVTSCLDERCYYGDTNVDYGESYDYYVATVDEWDGDEIGSSRTVTINVPDFSSVEVPAAPVAVGLDGAVFLEWAATGAQRYMVLGQAESEEIFIIGETDGTSYLDDRAENGTRYRYYLAAVEEESGHISGLSSAAEAFPRPDYHADVVYAFEDDAATSGFRFVTTDTGNPIVGGGATGAQWRLEADGAGLRIQPIRQTLISAGAFTTQLTCGPGSETDCEDIAAAPSASQLGGGAVAVRTGHSYVLRVVGDDNRNHFAKLRVQGSSIDTEGRRLIVFDWAYQLRPDEPSLQLIGDRPIR